jgi:hypothetical protein
LPFFALLRGPQELLFSAQNLRPILKQFLLVRRYSKYSASVPLLHHCADSFSDDCSSLTAVSPTTKAGIGFAVSTVRDEFPS